MYIFVLKTDTSCWIRTQEIEFRIRSCDSTQLLPLYLFALFLEWKKTCYKGSIISMDDDFQGAVPRAVRRNQQHQHTKVVSLNCGKLSQDYTMRTLWKRVFIRLVLTGGIVWMMIILTVFLFHVWYCQSSVTFFYSDWMFTRDEWYFALFKNIVALFAALCNKDSKVFGMLHTMGLVIRPSLSNPCCFADDPNKIVILMDNSPEKLICPKTLLHSGRHCSE